MSDHTNRERELSAEIADLERQLKAKRAERVRAIAASGYMVMSIDGDPLGLSPPDLRPVPQPMRKA